MPITDKELPIALLLEEIGKARSQFEEEILKLEIQFAATAPVQREALMLRAAKNRFDAGAKACAELIITWRKEHGGDKAEAQQLLHAQLMIMLSWFQRQFEKRTAGPDSHLKPLSPTLVEFVSHANRQIEITLAFAESGYADNKLVWHEPSRWKRLGAFLKEGGGKIFWGVVIALTTAIVFLVLSKYFGINLKK